MQMQMNRSGQHLYLTADGRIVAGYGHPEARTLLAAPGADVSQDWIVRHPALKDALRARPPEPEAKMVPRPAEDKQITMPSETKAALAPEATAEPDGKAKGKAGK